MLLLKSDMPGLRGFAMQFIYTQYINIYLTLQMKGTKVLTLSAHHSVQSMHTLSYIHEDMSGMMQCVVYTILQCLFQLAHTSRIEFIQYL